jgi:hypothetical protein
MQTTVRSAFAAGFGHLFLEVDRRGNRGESSAARPIEAASTLAPSRIGAAIESMGTSHYFASGS